jgi:hypothetical protein
VGFSCRIFEYSSLISCLSSDFFIILLFLKYWTVTFAAKYVCYYSVNFLIWVIITVI